VTGDAYQRAHFLIEEAGYYRTAVELELRRTSLEAGASVEADYSFRSFMSVFPHFLIQKMVERARRDKAGTPTRPVTDSARRAPDSVPAFARSPRVEVIAGRSRVSARGNAARIPLWR